MNKYLVMFTAVLCAVLAMFTLTFSAQAQDAGQGIETANQYFEDRLYSKAIQAYEPLLQSKNADIRYEAELKTVISYQRQHKYDEALRTVYSYKVPSSNLWKARYYMVKFASFKNVYVTPEHEETQTDPTRFTMEQREAEKKAILNQLWNMRKQLANMPYGDSKDYSIEDYYGVPYFNVPKSAIFPTLFDYLIPVWANNHTLEETALYEEAYKIKGRDRAAAAELWHIRRVTMIETDTEDFFTIKSNWLQFIAGMTDTYRKAYGVEKYIFQADGVLPKAQAAYLAAVNYESLEMYEEAVKTLDYCIGLNLNTLTKSCQALKKNISRPELSLKSNGVADTAQPDKEYTLQVETRNLDKFYVHIFKLEPSNFKNKNGLYNLPPSEVKLGKPVRSLGLSVSYDKPYAYHTSHIQLPKGERGFYAIQVSKDKSYATGDTPSYNLFFINFTDLALAATAYAKPKNLAAQTSLGDYFNVYTLDAKTGMPKSKTRLATNMSKKVLYTNTDGIYSLRNNAKKDSLNILASKADNYAIINNLWFNKDDTTKYHLALNTDMAIYKAGSKIKAQVTAAEFKGEKGYLSAEGKNITVALRGPNYTFIEEKTLKLDSNGSANYEYTLPKDAMLGEYRLSANLDKSSTVKEFSVEAFKTPEFEVILDKNTAPIKFGQPLNVQGKAKYYYGLNVAGAKVSYEIRKSSFFPIFWRAPKIYAQDEGVREGSTSTDKNGNFTITFTPQQNGPEDSELAYIPAKYTVQVFVTDKAGNTISSTGEYLVSKKDTFFEFSTVNNFFRYNTQNTIEVKMVNINGEALSGKATSKLYTASAPEDWNNGLEASAQVKKDKIARIDSIEFTDKNSAFLTIPPLKEGWYILEMTPEGKEKASEDDTFAFMVVNTSAPALSLPENTAITEAKNYYPGENALILLGSPKIKSNKYVEIYKDGFLVKKETVNKFGATVLELPITEAYQGGLTAAWFAVYDYEYFDGDVNINVPFINSTLKAELSGTEYSIPGSKKTISLTATDSNNIPVDAKAVVTIYDKALDYYRPHTLNTLNAYNMSFSRNPNTSSLNNSYLRPMVKEAIRGGLVATKAMAVNNFALDSVERGIAETSDEDYAIEVGDVQFRAEFSPNALWLPALDIKQGFSEFTFDVPQNVGEWNVLAALFTKNAQTGKTDFTFITRKDLMLNLEAPRFLRTGDEIELRAIVSNTTNRHLSTEVNLTVNHSCDKATGDCITAEYPATSVALAPQGQHIVKWHFKAPFEGEDIMFSASAKSAALSDGEIKTIPLLPSKQQLTSSRTAVIKKGTNKLFLGGVPKDAEMKAVHITISPSLLMPVLNAMPLLTKANTSLSTYVAYSYFPLAIFDKLYKDYPQLKEAAAKLPKRNSVTPAWNINEELLINDIAQSPWYLLSRGYEKQASVLNIFDADLVSKMKHQAERDLARFQNNDGGYAWVKGGKSSMFITLNILENFAQARSYGIEIDEEAAKKAINYVLSGYEEKDNVNINIYAAYILTAFPKEWNENITKIADKALVQFEENALQTPLAYAYAAAVYHRMGQSDKATLQIERLFDTSNYSELTGTSWTMEDRTWQWFEDGLNLHAVALKVLTEINPKDTRADGLVKWLIFNEKSEAWGNTQNAAKAVYALMGVMIQDGVFDQTKIFTTEWNGSISKVTVEPYSLDTSKLTLSAYDNEITSDVFKATINKSVLTMETESKDFDDYATITALFTSEAPEAASKDGLISVNKDYFLIKNGKAVRLKEGAPLNPGDEVQVRLTVKAQSAFDFVVISDQKPASFEADTLLSGWKYDGQLVRYEELKDNVTNFYLQDIPRGTYELKYTLRPTSPGYFTAGAAVMQSMFMPEVTTHSNGFKVRVK